MKPYVTSLSRNRKDLPPLHENDDSARDPKAVDVDLSELRFDSVRMFLAENKDDDDGVKLWEKCENPCAQPWKEKFLTGVTQSLHSYPLPHMQSFEISFCLTRHEADAIDGWVLFVLQKGVQCLTLSLQCANMCGRTRSECVDDSADYSRDNRYVFRTELLDSAKTSLEELHLNRCEVDLAPNFSDHVCGLRALSLTHVTFSQWDALDINTMFSSLGQLQLLGLTGCVLPEELSVTPLLHLQGLSIRFCPGIRRLKLPPQADLMDFHCVTEQTVSVDLSCFNNLHSLRCSLDGTGLRDGFSFSCLPHWCPGLRYVSLTIWRNSDWVNRMPLSVTAFIPVRQLSIFFMVPAGFSFSILRAFPTASKLILSIHCGDALEPIGKDKPGTFAPVALKEVVIRCCPAAFQHHTEFAMSLLKHADGLEQLTMILCGCCRKRWTCDGGERERVSNLLQGVSKNVSVIIE